MPDYQRLIDYSEHKREIEEKRKKKKEQENKTEQRRINDGKECR